MFKPGTSPIIRPFLFLILLTFIGAALPAWAQNGITADQLAGVKAATALILVNSPGEESSGSGFLINRTGDTGYVATNEHVVDTDENANRRVRVVFNSGLPGTERMINATVVAEDEVRDLAILKIGATNLPDPLTPAAGPVVRETSPVWVFGFPFGEMLATSRMHPAITVTTGTVTSIRLNDYGKITRIQVDADVNEGNSGGPIVDVNGGVIGIATEKIEDTKIGLGLPVSELQEMLQGRVKSSSMRLVTNSMGKASYRPIVVLIDPLRRVKSVVTCLIPQAQADTPKANADGRFGQLSPAMTGYPLKWNETEEYDGLIFLENPNFTDVTYWQQVRLELADGQILWTQPVPLTVPFSKGYHPATLPPAPKPPATPNVAPGVDDWLGTGAPVGAAVAGGVPSPENSNRLMLGPVRSEGYLTFQAVDTGGSVTPNCLWSLDGKFAYLIDVDGTLHKTSVPQFQEQKILRTGTKPQDMVLTASGLAVSFPALQEIWLVDPNDLHVIKRIAVGGMAKLAGSPKLNKVYVLIGDDLLSVIELPSGKLLGQVKARDIVIDKGHRRNDLGNFRLCAVTQDGQYLVCGDANINRLRIEGDGLVYEESSPDIGWGTNSRGVTLSGDSKYAALLSGGGNDSAPGLPPRRPYSTFIFKLSDLKMPVLTVESGAYPRAIAFDKAAGLIYAQNFEQSLMVFSRTGLLTGSFHLAFKRGQETIQILPHPAGRKLLVLADGILVWVVLPDEA